VTGVSTFIIDGVNVRRLVVMAQIVFEPIGGRQMWFPVIENNDHLAARKINMLCCLYNLLGERDGHRTPGACVMRVVGLYVSPVWRIVTRHLHFEQFQSRGPWVYAFGDLYNHREYILCYLLANSMEQSPWEPDRFSTSQEISRVLCNPKVLFRVYKSPPPPPVQHFTL